MWMNGNMRSVRVPVSQFTLPVLWKQLSTWCWKSAGRRVGWIPQPISRARLWLCLLASEMGAGSLPVPPHCLSPRRLGALARSTLAWRPGSVPCRCPCFPPPPPVPLPSSLPALLPSRRETRVCWQHACLPCPFGCSLTVLDLSQRFSSLISLLMALHLTESLPPVPHPFIFKSELILGPSVPEGLKLPCTPR